ncbi:MAG: hypothetical protein JF603_12365 [Acidobacteria bacterium]|nr:hypothetical protein [Acidobacteriota bacterium]
MVALPLWTLFVWLIRVRNVVRDDGAGAGLIVPVALCGLAVYALVDRRRGLPVLAAATVAVWVVRLPMVLAHDHAAAFKIVHAGLGAVSLALAGLAVRSLRLSEDRPLPLR